MMGPGWRVTIDQVADTSGHQRHESVWAGKLGHAITQALRHARLTEAQFVAGRYQITAVATDVADDVQAQLGVCPACAKNAAVVNTVGDRFVCDPARGGCRAQWFGARLGVPR